MSLDRRGGLPALFGVLAILSLLTARGLLPEPFERLRLLSFDVLQRLAPWREPPGAVTIIGVDDESVNRLGQWPWSRSTVARLVLTLQDLGATAIAFDMVFSEPDRTSPALLAKVWGDAAGGPRNTETSFALPDYDQQLAAAIARGRVVTGYGLLGRANGLSPIVRASLATIGGDPTAAVQSFRGAVPNLRELESVAAGNGHLEFTAGRDEIVRRIPMLSALNGELAPALALETVRVATGEDTIVVRADREGGGAAPITGMTVRIGDLYIPLDADGYLNLHYSARKSLGAIPAWRLLDASQQQGLASQIKDHIVIIGATAVGLSDLRSTPLNPLEPGVDLHAQAIEQILAHHFLIRPAWLPGAEFVAAALTSTFIVAVASFASLFSAALVASAALALLFGGTWIAFSIFGILFDPSFVVATTIVGAVTASYARYSIVDRDAARLRRAFAHYLSPALVAALARDPGRLKLGGEQREMTFVFTDIEGFTSLTEIADPSDIVDWLNNYLDGLCRIAMEHGGTIDKIVGDGVHVIFNAPLDQPDHAERGVRCALAIDAFAQRFSAEHKARGVAFGATRIGVNTGAAVVGNFGGSRRFDYTAHGDAINIAARLEAANKVLGTRICVARATAERASGIAFLPVGTLMLRGKSRGVDVLTPEGEPDLGDRWTDDYLNAFAQIADGDERGPAALLRLADRHPRHPVLALHARRIRAGERSVRMAA